ncbi:hypothetical protein [uncultured Roseobacter sp.]|uniref:hypothetical protein n=1 Tax=uncultured Roseobacter sp. TaxID=114847 RepID=UPI002601FCC3|nr:hypothetical protein [uncultured Roseobacter sp.]
MSKTAIVIYSDPKTNSEEALGRVFNAMFLAYELKEKKQDVALIFQGTGVRWVSELITPDHHGQCSLHGGREHGSGCLPRMRRCLWRDGRR